MRQLCERAASGVRPSGTLGELQLQPTLKATARKTQTGTAWPGPSWTPDPQCHERNIYIYVHGQLGREGGR